MHESELLTRITYNPQIFGGGVFEPLVDVTFFRKVRVDEEAGTLVSPNGVDLDPDILYRDRNRSPSYNLCPANFRVCASELRR